MVSGGIMGEKKYEAVLWDRDNWRTLTCNSYVDDVLVPLIQPFREREWAHCSPSLAHGG